MADKWVYVQIDLPTYPFREWRLVYLPGVPDSQPLRPRHARQAVNIEEVDLTLDAARVWSEDEYGYIVYENSHRKIPRGWDYEESES